ncbi:1-pyrroline-5-carboxylate dehydrogenase [Cladophialophora bantiana CBS 173.52]|uniref:L-glutamate gamma-semialdehyde dehydrogenase n=1 Tax=Cladophialophora bantiana (strain ATCC 10958 / CBS 173.52 / CDC B-1940 / NIH 8579) TaxID=1442370 RepID=A0A0D2EJE7_CLAB1|nr:1-pyrroline-5-carboxylate dehydrogenase [Cladophialophora bantiana CBS 173.52]KIW90176.1 1-pyrroline-5-carboxylate dehydrogenase [Cladophialophora bantiana CBS 173.52]
MPFASPEDLKWCDKKTIRKEGEIPRPGFANAALLATWVVGDQVFIGIIGGEAKSPRFSMAHATKLVPFRVNSIHMISIGFITVLVPSNDPQLLGGSGIAASPFVIAIQDSGIPGIVSLLNPGMMCGVLAIAAESVYISSRVLRTLAHRKLIPELLARVDSQGRPRWGYINHLRHASAPRLHSSISITSASYFIIAFTNRRFHCALEAQNDALFKELYAWKSSLWPLAPGWLITISPLLLGCCIAAGIDLSGAGFTPSNFFEYIIGVYCMTGRRTLAIEEINQLDEYYKLSKWRRFLTYVQLWLLSTAGTYKTPMPFNEPNLHYTPSSLEREKLIAAVQDLRQKLPLRVPSIKNGQEEAQQPSPSDSEMYMPSEISSIFAKYTPATAAEVSAAIEAVLMAKKAWQDMPFVDRAAVFLRAAELVSEKYTFELMAATMLRQGKNAWQAEIDAAAELADFFRCNVSFAEEIYSRQPKLNERGQAGFVYAISPFNFTAIGGNLVSGPSLLGIVVLWKPSPSNIYANFLVYKILREAGLPPNVVPFIGGDAETITRVALAHSELSAINFTGSSDVFRSLYGKIADGVKERKYRDFPRLVAETSGKNFHLIHPSADISNDVKHTIRASFEYAGQKCSACSRIYIPENRAQQFFSEMRRAETGQTFNKVTRVIDAANTDSRLELVAGGRYDGSKGFFIEPTVYSAKTLDHPLFDQELFGPILVAYVYRDADFDSLLAKIDQQGGGFALTGSIFATDPVAIRSAEDRLRYAAGNFYINCKTTGAVIGQQSFGGARCSSTNDKAGSANMLMRFTAPRTLKEEYHSLDSVLYPSNC